MKMSKNKKFLIIIVIVVSIMFVKDMVKVKMFIFNTKKTNMIRDYDYDSIKTREEYDELFNKYETVKFGRYKQDNSLLNKEIEWFVLDKKDGKALLLSKYLLDYVEFDKKNIFQFNDSEDVSWEKSSLRKWLNNYFYNKAFNLAEKSIICSVENTNYASAYSDRLADNNTIEKVFCLSTLEWIVYFNDKESFARITSSSLYLEENYRVNAETHGTKYYVKKVNKKVVSKGGPLYDEFGEIMNTYWLRTVTNIFNHEVYEADGSLNETELIDQPSGVRPCIWVQLDNAYDKKTYKNELQLIKTSKKFDFNDPLSQKQASTNAEKIAYIEQLTEEKIWPQELKQFLYPPEKYVSWINDIFDDTTEEMIDFLTARAYKALMEKLLLEGEELDLDSYPLTEKFKKEYPDNLGFYKIKFKEIVMPGWESAWCLYAQIKGVLSNGKYYNNQDALHLILDEKGFVDEIEFGNYDDFIDKYLPFEMPPS